MTPAKKKPVARTKEEVQKLLSVKGDEDVVDRRYVAIGGAKEFFLASDLEVLLESGAGTGKSYSVMRKADWGCRNYQGLRVLFCRKTRKSMNESVLRDWEEKVLWPTHPAMMASGATREHRDTYPYANGAVIVLGGLDNVDRIMSAQYDWIFIFEATEATLEDWEKLLSRLRNGKGPYHQIAADCNPAHKHHWLNRRFPEFDGDRLVARKGPRARIGYRHEDNPLWYNNDLGGFTSEGIKYVRDVLGNLTGHRRARLLEHKWVSAEGLIWPDWDESKHVIEPEDAPTMDWHFATKDFGYRNPGCLHVWGVKDRRMYCVAEVYASEQELDWWATWAEELWHEFGYVPGIADCAEPRSIRHLNDRMGSYTGRSGPGLWQPSDKTKGKIHGLNMVRWGLQLDNSGHAHIYFLRNAPRYKDPKLQAAYQPTSLIEEVGGYTFKEDTGGRMPVEQPDPTCPNHACDSLEMGAVWLWKKDRNPVKAKPSYPEGSYGDLFQRYKKK